MKNWYFTSVLGTVVSLLFCNSVNSLIYDYYTGKSVSAEYVLRYAHSPNFAECTVSVRPCSNTEPRRVDGSCNNLKMPTRGMQRTPFKRLLTPNYGPIRYLFQITHCCTQAGLHDPRCIPIQVPTNDPYLKETGVTCLNFTRATTYQEYGCLTDQHSADQINHQTPFLDMSNIYGPNNTVSHQLRSFDNGMLKMELRNGHVVPPSDRGFCVANEKGWPCYELGDSSGNFQPKRAIFAIWFMKLHNELASGLALINPCWSDEKLFQVARQINIAIGQKIFLHEWVGNILGFENMLKRGLISSDGGYVNVYEEKLEPALFVESIMGSRALHLFLDDSFGLYDEKAKLVGVTSLNRWLFGTGVIEQDDNMEMMGRSVFYQPSSDGIGYSDTALAENFFMRHQKAHDLFSTDIQRSRDFGLRTYNEYRRICGMHVAKTFEDLHPDIENEKIIALRNLYHDVDSIELFAGILAEKLVPGAVVGPTLFCLIETQVDYIRKSDRFWYEREHALGLRPAQLAEIRNVSLALVACYTADGLKSIQPQAMQIISDNNPLLQCDKYRRLNISEWRDDNCDVTPQGRTY